MKKSMMMGMVYALALILILAGVYVVASGQQIAAGGYESQGGVNTYEDQTKSCPVAMNVQVMSTDYAKAGTGASTTSYVYDNLGNVKATSLANQTDLGVSGYKTYTFLTDGSNMFAHKYEHTFGCNGNEVVNAKVPQADTSATISFINTDGVTINAATANESVTTGQSITPTIKVKNGASYKYITSPYCTKYVITLQAANISAWDLSQTTIDGCTEISVPKVERGTAHQAFECSAPTGVIGNFQGDARAVHLALLPTGTVNGVATDDYWVFKVYPEDNVPNSITGMPMGCVAENNVGTAAQTAITSGGTYWMR